MTKTAAQKTAAKRKAPAVAKSATAEVQFIRTSGGDLAVMPRAAYERLNELARGAREDAAAQRLIRASNEAIAAGRETVIPLDLATRIADGDNPVKVFREWRGLAQGKLSERLGIAQGYLSEIEAGKKRGPADLLKRIAEALNVPVASLI